MASIILLLFLCVNEKYIADLINISKTGNKETTELLHTFSYFSNKVSYSKADGLSPNFTCNIISSESVTFYRPSEISEIGVKFFLINESQ